MLNSIIGNCCRVRAVILLYQLYPKLCRVLLKLLYGSRPESIAGCNYWLQFVLLQEMDNFCKSGCLSGAVYAYYCNDIRLFLFCLFNQVNLFNIKQALNGFPQ